MLDNQELRAVYIEELIRYAKTDDRITLVEADLSKALSSPKFKAAYPERLIDVGICEANMIGVAARPRGGRQAALYSYLHPLCQPPRLRSGGHFDPGMPASRPSWWAPTPVSLRNSTAAPI